MLAISSQSSLRSSFQFAKPKPDQQKLYFETVQKSGSHLLTKILNLLKIKRHKRPSWTHLHHVTASINTGASLEQIFPKQHKYIVLYRDPRDLLISMLFYRMREKESWRTINYAEFKTISFDECINRCLNYELYHQKEIGAPFGDMCKSLRAAVLVKKANFKNVMLVRFEELIRPQAGGNPNHLRFKTFKKICNFAGVHRSDETIRNAMEQCWGDQPGQGTFRAKEPKKVGQWQKYFKPHHIQTFHDKFNDLLLDLGYETDPDWHLKYLPETNNEDNAVA